MSVPKFPIYGQVQANAGGDKGREESCKQLAQHRSLCHGGTRYQVNMRRIRKDKVEAYVKIMMIF